MDIYRPERPCPSCHGRGRVDEYGRTMVLVDEKRFEETLAEIRRLRRPPDPMAPCACKVILVVGNALIEFCPLHAQAGAMRDLIADTLVDADPLYPQVCFDEAKGRAILKAIEGLDA